MKILKPIFILTILLFNIGCKQNSSLYEEGISIELATLRKNNISRINYDLSFTIPSNEDSSIIGSATITFNIDKKEYNNNLILDYKISNYGKIDEVINNLIINNKEVPISFKNEHIIISQKHINDGCNIITINYIVDNSSLNRREDFLYTLLVPDRARTLFPCFEQPDMKATYCLSLTIPNNWEAISNSAISEISDTSYLSGSPCLKGHKTIKFSKTEPLSTYLFAFVCGAFYKSQHFDKGNSSVKSINIFHRETNKEKLNQLDIIADNVFSSIEWIEKYTDIDYPFSKYDLIIIPGFQYGGMEHTGATLYNDTRMFLPSNPTIQQVIERTELIAHETAHMWFGDYVTMDWFSDVWIKEVFANFFASKIVRPIHPDIDYALNDLNFYINSYTEERTKGANPIEQQLPNLKYAGLLYGNIIYQKSPIVMEMLYNIIGENNFKKSIREYLNKYKYSNASWDDLIAIFSKNNSQNNIQKVNLDEWNQFWIYGIGMPEPTTNSFQNMRIDTIINENIICNNSNGNNNKTHQNKTESIMWPNSDGKYYGYIKLDSISSQYILNNLYNKSLPFYSAVMRQSALITLNENYLNNNLSPQKFITYLCDYLHKEDNPQIFPLLLKYINSLNFRNASDTIKENDNKSIITLHEYIETKLYDYIYSSNNNINFATQAFRLYSNICSNDNNIEEVYKIWKEQKSQVSLLLNENDYINIAYSLCLKNNFNSNTNIIKEIINIQSKRIKNPDKLKEFLYISTALSNDTTILDSLFNQLLTIQGRRPEPWAIKVLSLLNHPSREKYSLKYIMPALKSLEEIQRTTDIFFPKNWINALLNGHYSKEASEIVDQFLENLPNDYPILLKNKILQSRYYMK